MRITLKLPMMAWSKNPAATPAGVYAPAVANEFPYVTVPIQVNNLFAPLAGTGNEFTTTAAQPYTYDQWVTFYKSYRVKGCLIEVYWDDADTVATTATQLAIRPASAADGTGSFPTHLAIVENEDTTVYHRQDFAGTMGLSGAGMVQKYAKRYIDCAKALGLTKKEYEDSPNTVGTGAAPALLAYANVIFVGSFEGGVIGANARFYLTFYVDMFAVNLLGVS